METTQIENTESKQIIGTNSDIITDENFETFKLLSLKSKMSDIESIVDDINNQQKKFVNDIDDFDPLDKILENLTEDEIKNMTFDQINKLLVDENGDPIEFVLDFNGDENKLNQFKKDFLIIRKQSTETINNFEKELEKINKEIAESQEDFDKAIAEFGNISTLIRRTLENRIDQATTEEIKNKYVNILKYFDYGLTLENVKEFCKSYKGQRILGDYVIDKHSEYVYRRYLKVAKSLAIKTDLASFTNLEKRFLDDEYCDRPNIFVFAIISYIASWHNKEYSKMLGLFITQFTVNLKNLYYDKFDNAEDKEIFINNIKEVINIIG